MSRVALQRVMVRMLFDPELTVRVLRDSRTALQGVDLSDEEHAWLAAPDRRSWSIDPGRPARALGSLVQRYPTSVAAAMRSGIGVDRLLRFFRSDFFHRSVQERGSMAMAFAEYLVAVVRSGAIADRRVEPLARLEQRMARLLVDAPAKPVHPEPAGGSYVLSPDKQLHRAPTGTADLHETIHGLLARCQEGLADALVDPTVALPSGGIDFARDEALLLEIGRGNGWRVSRVVGASEITEELYTLLAFALEPQNRAALEGETIALGSTPSEAREVVAGLIGDGTLVPAAAPMQPRA